MAVVRNVFFLFQPIYISCVYKNVVCCISNLFEFVIIIKVYSSGSQTVDHNRWVANQFLVGLENFINCIDSKIFMIFYSV